MSLYEPAFDIHDRTQPLFPGMFAGGDFPADAAPRRLIKSRYACAHPPCERGPATGHTLTNGYCDRHVCPTCRGSQVVYPPAIFGEPVPDDAGEPCPDCADGGAA